MPSRKSQRRDLHLRTTRSGGKPPVNGDECLEDPSSGRPVVSGRPVTRLGKAVVWTTWQSVITLVFLLRLAGARRAALP